MTYKYQTKSGSAVTIKESERMMILQVEVNNEHFDFLGESAYPEMMMFLEANDLKRAYSFY